MTPTPEQIERAIERLLDGRSGSHPPRTICPSEAARALEAENWRELMEPVRRQAFAMADAGRLEVTQGGEVVDGRAARGPIRLRRSSARRSGPGAS